MFEKIGAKIKVLSKIIFILEAILSFIMGVAFLVDDVIALGIISILLGPIIALSSAWLIYGFGEMVEKVSDISDSIRNLQSSNVATKKTLTANERTDIKEFNVNDILVIPKRNK